MKRITIIVLMCCGMLMAGLSIWHLFIPSSVAAQPIEQADDLSNQPSSATMTSIALTQTEYFTAYLPLVFGPEGFVSGRITDQEAPVPGVLVASSAGRSGLTDANGMFEFNVPDGVQIITPTLAGYVFSPTMRQITIPPNALNQDFAATPPPCAATNTVFFDDFSNPGSGWGTENIAAWYRHYINGEYEATLHINTELFHAAPGIGNTLGNFVVSADLRQTDAPEYGDGYGLWIGSASLGKYYEFYVRTNTMFMALGNYNVGYYDRSASQWIGKDHGTSSAVNMENAVNTLRIHRCGTRYYFYANNTLLTSVIMPELADQQLTTGYYVRAVHDATVRLDNFRVQNAAP